MIERKEPATQSRNYGVYQSRTRASSAENLTAFLGCKSDLLPRGEIGGDDISEGAEAPDRLCGKNRAIRNFIAANERGEWDDDGVIDVTVVVDPEALENGGLTAGLLEDDVTVVADGFLSDERVGGGGRVMGVVRWWGWASYGCCAELRWEKAYGDGASGRRCGVRERCRPMAICSIVGREDDGSGSLNCCRCCGMDDEDSAMVGYLADF